MKNSAFSCPNLDVRIRLNRWKTLVLSGFKTLSSIAKSTGTGIMNFLKKKLVKILNAQLNVTETVLQHTLQASRLKGTKGRIQKVTRGTFHLRPGDSHHYQGLSSKYIVCFVVKLVWLKKIRKTQNVGDQHIFMSGNRQRRWQEVTQANYTWSLRTASRWVIRSCAAKGR